MNPLPSALGSAQIADQVIKMDALRQRLLAEGLISPFNGGSLSLKLTVLDLYNQPVEALLLQTAGSTPALLARLAILRNLAKMEHLSEADLQRELFACRLTEQSPTPDPYALLHACLPAQAAVFVTHPAVLALGCTSDWQQQVQAVYGQGVTAVDYAEPGYKMYQAAAKNVQDPTAGALYLRYYGLLVWAGDLESACQSALHLAELARRSASTPPVSLEPIPLAPSLRVAVAQRRREISAALGTPQVLRLLGAFPSGTDSSSMTTAGAPSEVHRQDCRNLPEPDPSLGLTIHAASAAELERQTGLLMSEIQIRMQAGRRGTLELLPKLTAVASTAPQGMFSGEVALVTGAATGIGQAAVQSLLERGAAVVALDIKPEITSIFESPAYLGLECDLTDEAATLDCLEKTVRAFGGLDMLVLNAGIFPASCNLESLTMELWREVMEINLDVNITLLRECYPLLKRSPRYGRVVINASRNVPAPGPGAAAYSASKAALTQLGRVAALEWASSGIRVNMLNPHAVFDTGIWTDEVLRSRAAKYGLTVEQYKTNNLLHVELTSRDLGELIAETLGPLFSKTTGAQIPVDGGSDRVI